MLPKETKHGLFFAHRRGKAHMGTFIRMLPEKKVENKQGKG